MFESIKRAINRKEFSFGKEIKALQIFRAFTRSVEAIFGEDISQKCNPISFYQGVLRIRTENSVIAQELHNHNQEILKAMKEPLVKRIVFQL